MSDKIREEYEEQAIDVLKIVLTALHEGRYMDVYDCVDESKYEKDEFIFEIIEDRAYDTVDEYGVPCNFNPQYEYSQMNIYEFNDNTGFALDYDLTTCSELMYLSLQLEFYYEDNGLRSVFVTIDPQ